MDSDPSVRILRQIPDLEEIRTVWESWPGNRDSEMESYLTFMRSNPSVIRPHILVLYRSGKPDAILVGRIDAGRISCRLGYLHLDPSAKILYFVYGAFRGNESKENSALLVTNILESLRVGEADVAYMNYLRDDSELFRLCVKTPSLLCRDYVRLQQPHFAAILPNSTEEFYRGLSSNARWQAKNKEKKLIKEFAGDVRIQCFRKTADLDTLITDVEKVAKTSYQRGLGVGFADSPLTREGLRLKAERGWLRGYVLYLGGSPSAFWIGDINDGTFGSDYLAYNAEVGKHSPGMYLTLKVIEGFCQNSSEGVRAIDFATGHAQYKEVLSNQQWNEASVHIFAPTLKGIALNLSKTLIAGLDQLIKKALSRTGLLQQIKKSWRGRATPREARQS